MWNLYAILTRRETFIEELWSSEENFTFYNFGLEHTRSTLKTFYEQFYL